MIEQSFQMTTEDQNSIYVYHWSPSQSRLDQPIIGIVQISHGMAEHAKRYERFAKELVEHGYIVYANDHRGHGKTAGNSEHLGFAGPDGLNGMVRDIIQLSGLIKKEHPDLPLFLMGHSLGSFLTQKVMYTAPNLYDGFILSGTCGKQAMLALGEKLATLQVRLQGDRHPSLMLNALVFGRYNKSFLPIETPFDWLSRDADEVKKYVDDKNCGFMCSTSFFRDMFNFLQQIHQTSQMNSIPKNIPIYLFSGTEDPVGLKGKGIRSLLSQYTALQLTNVEYKLYPGGRHEMLNEINRDEVTADVLSWLERHVER